MTIKTDNYLIKFTANTGYYRIGKYNLKKQTISYEK